METPTDLDMDLLIVIERLRQKKIEEEERSRQIQLPIPEYWPPDLPEWPTDEDPDKEERKGSVVVVDWSEE